FTLFMKADENYVYWASNDNIHRASIVDGADTVLYQPTATFASIGGIELVGSTLYFVESAASNGLGLAQMPADGSAAPVTLAADGVSVPTFSEGFIYYETGHGALARIPIAGGTPVELVTGIS